MKKLTKSQKAKVRKMVLTKSGKINRVVGVEALHDTCDLLAGYFVHFRRSGSRGKSSTVSSADWLARDIVKALGYKVEIGNNAPRGGVLGDYFYKAGRPVKVTFDELLAALDIVEG